MLRTPSRIRSALGLGAAVAAWLAVPGPELAANVMEEPEARSWTAEYVLGTERVKKLKNLKVSVGPEGIVARAGDRYNVRIPSAGLVAATLDVWLHCPLEYFDRPHVAPETAFKLWDPVESTLMWLRLPALAVAAVGSGAFLFPEAAFDAVVDIVDQSRAIAELNDRFVCLVWREESTARNMLLRLDKDHAIALLAAIQETTGKPWIDLPAYREKFFEALEKQNDRSVGLELDRDARVSGRELDAGSYHLVLLKGAQNQGRVFIFKGDRPRPGKLAALTDVRLEQGAGEAASPEVRYAEDQDEVVISEIHLGDVSLRPRPDPPRGKPATTTYAGVPALRFEAQKGRVALVSLADYKGERALRFPVSRLKFKFQEGFIYVTPTRIAFDPVFTPERKGGFEAPREQVNKIGHARKMGAAWVEVELAEEVFYFGPHYEGGEPQLPSRSRSMDRQIVEAFRDISRRSATRAGVSRWEFCELLIQAFADFGAAEARLSRPQTQPTAVP